MRARPTGSAAIAEAEPMTATRNELLAVARQYQNLADGLKTGAPFTAEV
jgi:hypothetical protein